MQCAAGCDTTVLVAGATCKRCLKSSEKRIDLLDFQKAWNKKARGVSLVFDPRAEELNAGCVPLEIPAIDDMLGGGVPKGRITIFVGEAASGKTLLAQLVIAAAQRAGGKALFFDIEHTFDERWFALTGVQTDDPAKLLVVRPRNLEQAFDMACDALERVQPDVLVLDSIPALVPKAVLDADMEKQDFRGVTARKVTAGVQNLVQFNQNTAIILINQLRINMGIKFGNPESMPGGKGLRFYTSLIVRTRRGAWITDAGDGLDFNEVEDEDGKKEAQRVGFTLRLRTEKNKLAPPWQEADLDFRFNGTVDWVSSLVHLALQRGVIAQLSPGYFDVPGIKNKVHGRASLEQQIRDDDALRTTLVAAVRKAKS